MARRWDIHASVGAPPVRAIMLSSPTFGVVLERLGETEKPSP
jgi:hypothetical protein